jgi:hypothetical protein
MKIILSFDNEKEVKRYNFQEVIGDANQFLFTGVADAKITWDDKKTFKVEGKFEAVMRGLGKIDIIENGVF